MNIRSNIGSCDATSDVDIIKVQFSENIRKFEVSHIVPLLLIKRRVEIHMLFPIFDGH